MPSHFLSSILDTLHKEFSNVPVKVEIFTQNKERITRITLKESTVQDSDITTRKSLKNPVEKKNHKKKNPSRIRRDAKRREAFLAKKSETSLCNPVKKDLPNSSSLSSTPIPSTPRRVVIPKRKLDSQHTEKEAGVRDSGDSMGGTEDSPIPQLDGGDMGTGKTIKPYTKFYFD